MEELELNVNEEIMEGATDVVEATVENIKDYTNVKYAVGGSVVGAALLAGALYGYKYIKGKRAEAKAKKEAKLSNDIDKDSK